MTHPSPIPQTPAAALDWRRELGWAALVALASVVCMLWRPILQVATHTLGPWDWLAQSSTLTALEPPPEVRTHAMEDPVRQMLPWAEFAARELREGDAPLWLDTNGCGMPLLANYQSALLSPFTLPHYFLPLALAVLLSAAAKLATAAGSMFLFLRLLARSRWAAAFGALGFALSGFHWLCLLHPHVGVQALAPLALAAVELVFRAAEREPGRVPWARLACVSFTLGGLALAGHPESLLFSGLLVGGYTLLRWITVVQQYRGDGVGLLPSLRLLATLATFGLLGIGLGGVQFLPFAEYLLHSAAFVSGERDVERLQPYQLVLQLFPNVATTPRDTPWIPLALRPRYPEVNAFHVGGLHVLLAFGVMFFPLARSRTWIFAVLGSATLLFAFDAPVVSEALSWLAGGALVPAPRACVLWSVAATVLASWTADRLFELDAPRGRSLAFVLAAGALVGLALAQIPALWSDLETRAPAQFAALAPQLEAHVRFATWAIALGLAAIVLHALLRRRGTRVFGLATACTLAAASSIQAFHDYVPTSEDRCVLPRTEALAGFQSTVGQSRALLLSPQGLRSDANLFYGIELVNSYDALEVARLDELRTEVFGVGSYRAVSSFATRRGLELFGVEFVGARAEWLPVDTERSRREAALGQRTWMVAVDVGMANPDAVLELTPEQPAAVQRFVPSYDGLCALVVHFEERVDCDDVQLTLTLRREGEALALTSRSVRFGELRRVFGTRRELVLRFSEMAASRQQACSLEVSASGLAADQRLRLMRGRGGRERGPDDGESKEGSDGNEPSDATRRTRRERTVPGRGLGSGFVLDLAYDESSFEIVGEHADFVVHRFRGSAGRAWLVGASEIEPRAELTLERVLSEEFDPRATVLLERGTPRSGALGPKAELRELERKPRRMAWSYSSDRPAFLVTALTHFPGWRATVDGRAVELLRANHAFCAVDLPPGEGEVVFEYEPGSFRTGLALTLASLFTLLLALHRGLRHARSRAN